jgi:methionine transaminase
LHLISKLPHIGTTIFTEMSALASKYNATNLAQGFPDVEVDKKLQQYIIEAMEKNLHQYAPMAGLPILLQALEQKIKTRNKRSVIADEEITITPGATYGIYTALATIIETGDEVIILEPAYDSYSPNITSLGGIVRKVSLHQTDFNVDWDAVKKAITQKTKAIIINTPHNPTGSIWQTSDIDALKDCVRGTNIYVISDEVYEYLSFDQNEHMSVIQDDELYARSFAVFSFGKVLQATGWKIGYNVAPKNLTTEFRKIHQYLAFSVNSLGQYAIANYLKNEHSLDSLSASFSKKRDLFLSLFEPLPFTVPFTSKGSYFQLLSYKGLSDSFDKDYAIELTKKAGVASIPVSSFYENKKDQKLLRFCFAKNDDTLIRAANQLKDYFKV